jgi:predicted PurR-regulated permease PerM
MLNSLGFEKIWPRKLLDVLIRAGLIAVLLALCYRIFAPFLTLMLWALILAILIGVVLIIAGIPYAGVLAIITLVLGVAQIPALLVTLPVVAYVWMSGNFDTAPAVFYTVLLLVSGFSDNVLKPLLLGRGVDAPMPVILLGALGGMVSAGILGMFAGAVLLALGYQLFMAWVADTNETEAASKAEPAAQA